MKRKSFLLASLFTLSGFFLQPALAVPLCSTHEVCKANTDCTCTVSASGMYARSFYFDFPAVQKNQVYECKLTSSLDAQFLLNESTLPVGSKAQCVGQCEWLPITLQLDTSLMVNKEDTLVLKYMIPPSDIPTAMTASCKLKNKQ